MPTYRILFNLSYDHKFYRQGDTIELSELQAEHLINHGALESEPDEESPPSESTKDGVVRLIEDDRR